MERLPNWATILGGGAAGLVAGFAVAAGISAEPSDSAVSLISLAFAAVAAIATVFAVVYARETVRAAEAATEASEEQSKAQVLAVSFAAQRQIGQINAATDESRKQHMREMAERADAYEIDIQIRQVAQFQRLADVYAELVDASRDRASRIKANMMVLPSNIHTLQARARLESTALKALGRAEPMSFLPEPTRDDSVGDLERLQQASMSALERLVAMIDSYDAFGPPPR